MAIELARTDARLPASVRVALAPIHRSAFGGAIGVGTGGLVFALTAFHLLVNPPEGLRLGLLGQFFPGYDVTWPGACIGFLWAWFGGFVAGWLAAFLHNDLVTRWIARVQRRAEREQLRDFLDQM